MNCEKKSNKKSSYFRKFGCLKIEENSKKGNAAETTGEPANPTHLVIMVNGIIGRSVLSSSFFPAGIYFW